MKILNLIILILLTNFSYSQKKKKSFDIVKKRFQIIVYLMKKDILIRMIILRSFRSKEKKLELIFVRIFGKSEQQSDLKKLEQN